MGDFFVYILKSAVCLALFYLFYRLLLSKETFHRFNRIALLGILLLSCLLPLVKVTVEQETEVHQTLLTLEQLLLLADMPMVEVEVTPPVISGIQIGMLLYLAGILFFFFRNLYSLARMCVLLCKGKVEKLENGIRLVTHEKEIAPFSWMRYIVISRKDLEENGREILIHEQAHIRKRHSIDLLLADVCIFFQWFNPAAWLLKQELQGIHEYEADEHVIKQGVDAKQYQLLLIKKAVGTRLYSMANSFNHSKLKKRITMMLKEKSSPWARLKYLYVLPLAVVTVTAFARPEVSEKADEISAVKVNDLAAIVELKLAETISVPVDSVKPVPVKVKEKTVTPKQTMPAGWEIADDKADSPVFYLNLAKAKEGEKVIVADQLTVADNQKFKSMPEVDTFMAKSLTIRGGEGKVVAPSMDSVLVIIDGKESTYKDLDGFDLSKINSVSVLKDAAAITLYGMKAKKGVILIETLEKSGKNTYYTIDDKTTSSTDKNALKNDQDKEGYNLGFIKDNGEIYIQMNLGPVIDAEKIKVTGKIVDERGACIPSAIVQVNGSSKGGALSNQIGEFTLSVSRNATLTILAVDKATKKVQASSEHLQVVLQDAK